MKSVFRFSLALSACLLLIAPVAFGQTTGTIVGTINGTDGRPLPGVTVEASSPSLQGTRVSVTGNDGNFRFVSLAPGTYKVRASLSGFTTVERTTTVRLDSAATVTMALQVSAKEELVVTGEAPVVDSTTAESGLQIRQETATKLPVGRNYASVVAIQPSVATDQSETQGRALAFSIYGATSVENSYLVDGINTTNVIKGFEGKALSQEFIEEVQVKSSGYEAEYGRSTGGVVNVVTKSGGNQFHGDAFGYFTEKGLIAEYKGYSAIVPTEDGENFDNLGTDAEYVVDRSQQNRQDYGADLGGFMMKDHIWFFGAYNRVTYTQDQTISIGSAPLYGTAGQNLPFDSTANIYSGKLTFRLGAGTTIVGTVFGDPESRTGNIANLTSTNPLVRNADRSIGAVDYAGSLTQLFGSSSLLTVRYAKHQDSFLLSPVPGGDGPQIRDNTTGTLVVSNGFGSIFGPTNNNHSSREAWTANGTFYLGNHEVKVGGDYENNKTFTTSYYTGGTRLQIFNCPNPTGDPNQKLCPAGSNIYYGHDFYTGDATNPPSAILPAGNVANPKSIRYSAFAQDKWTIIPALTVSVGLRWDQEAIKDYTDTTIFTLKNEWQPRIGIAWDVIGDGSSKLAASAGRFYFALPTDLNVRAYGAQTTATVWNFDSCTTTDSSCIFQDANAPRNTNVQGGAFTEPVQGFTPGCGTVGFPACEATLKGIYQDEYTLGFDKAIDPTFAVGVKGTYRHYGRAIEDRCDLDSAFPEANGNTCVIFNPGSDSNFGTGDFHGCSGFDSLPFDNPPVDGIESACNSQALTPISQPLPPGGVYNTPVPKAKREYWAGEIVAKKQVGRSLWVQASYIYSSLTGNYDGAARQANAGQTDPGINADFDYAAFLINADGKLYLDRPNAFRLDAAYTFPFNLTFGFTGFVRSGAPKDKVGYFNSQYGTELLLVQRGSYGRLPTDYEINASLGYTLKIAPVDITLFLQGFNLINRQTVIQVDNEYTQDIPGAPDEFYGSFDKAVTRRAPRSLVFGARISF